MNQKIMRCVFVVLFVGMGAGCLHSPPAGATRGVLEIRNMRVWDESRLLINVSELTGVSIDEHTVLTAAHTFIYDPEPDHPLKINGQSVAYSIVADGWAGIRGEREIGDLIPTPEQRRKDYLILRVDEPLDDYATLVPFEFDRVSEIRSATMVTRKRGQVEPIAIALRNFQIDPDGDLISSQLRFRRSDGYRISGSPLIGTYGDGTLVLIGVANSLGTLAHETSGKTELLENAIIFTPAYRIPLGNLTSP